MPAPAKPATHDNANREYNRAICDIIDYLQGLAILPGWGIDVRKIRQGWQVAVDPDIFDYDGPFKVEYNSSNATFTVLDGGNRYSPAAGDAYINGSLKEIAVKDGIPFDNTLMEDGIITGEQRGFVCLTLNSDGVTDFKFVADPDNRIYDGYFAVVYDKETDKVLVIDGSLAPNKLDSYLPDSEPAGYAYLNGRYKSVDGDALAPETGVLCLCLDSSGQTTYKIVSKPDTITYDGEFAVDFSASTGQLNVFDGSFKSGSGTAGHAFLNGTWTSIPSGSLTLKNGYLCLKYSAAGVSYEIVNNPKRLI